MKLLYTAVKKIPSVLFLGLLVAEASHADWVYLSTRQYTRLCPEWIGGDREYAGHGPEVSGHARLFTQNSNNELYIDIEMRQVETVADWSEAVLTRRFLIYKAPESRQITSIWNSDTSVLDYVDEDHLVDRFFPTDNLVREFQVNGDTSGKDIGNCTSDDAYLSVYLKPLWVFIE